MYTNHRKKRVNFFAQPIFSPHEILLKSPSDIFVQPNFVGPQEVFQENVFDLFYSVKFFHINTCAGNNVFRCSDVFLQ